LGCVVQLWLEGSETKEIFVKFGSEILRLFCCFRIEANQEKSEREMKTKNNEPRRNCKRNIGSRKRNKGKLGIFVVKNGKNFAEL
jgi:hypothetical protein